MHWYPGWSGGWGIAMMVVMVLFWLLALAVFVLVIREIFLRTSGQRRVLVSGIPTETALEILERRYARGEITREEYERMRMELLHGRA